MSQNKIKATELIFQDFRGKICLFLLIFYKFLVLLTKLNIKTDHNTNWHISFHLMESLGMPQYAS